jgi:hypothetical protein
MNAVEELRQVSGEESGGRQANAQPHACHHGRLFEHEPDDSPRGRAEAQTARRSLSTAEPLCTRARRRGQLRQRRVRTRRTFRAARHTVGAAPGSPSLALPSSSCCRAQARDPARVLAYERLKQEKPGCLPSSTTPTPSRSAKPGPRPTWPGIDWPTPIPSRYCLAKDRDDPHRRRRCGVPDRERTAGHDSQAKRFKIARAYDSQRGFDLDLRAWIARRTELERAERTFVSNEWY